MISLLTVCHHTKILYNYWLYSPLMLKLHYFGHLMWRANSLEKTLILGKIEGRKRRGQQRTRWLDGITDSMDMSLSKLWAMVEGQRSLECCSSCRVRHDGTTEKQHIPNSVYFIPVAHLSYIWNLPHQSLNLPLLFLSSPDPQTPSLWQLPICSLYLWISFDSLCLFIFKFFRFYM